MGADTAIERHDGTPPGEDQIAARMRAEGLSPHGWGNGPGDTYGWHEHGYEKVLYCGAAGSCSASPAATSSSARETRWSSRRISRTRRRSVRGACAASKRPGSETRARLTGDEHRAGLLGVGSDLFAYLVNEHRDSAQKHPTVSFIKDLVEHPGQVLTFDDARHWSERTVVMLCSQTTDTSIEL